MFPRRLLGPVLWSGLGVLLSCPMNSRLSCSLQETKGKNMWITLLYCIYMICTSWRGGERKMSRECICMCWFMEEAATGIRARCVCVSVCACAAYVLRLPYALPPVLAVKTLLSISWGGDLIWWQYRDKVHHLLLYEFPWFCTFDRLLRLISFVSLYLS